MRFAKVTFVIGSGLFMAAGVGLVGTWALAASTIVMGVAVLVAVIAMEERDFAPIEGLYPAASEADGMAAEAMATDQALTQAA